MRRTIALALALVAVLTSISGCTTLESRAISGKAVEDISQKTVAYTSRAKPDFAAMTPGKAMFGLIGSAMMIAEGNQLVADNNLPDPANVISDSLVGELEGGFGAKRAPAVKVTGDDVAQIAAAAQGTARYVVDTQTIQWIVAYFPSDFTRYRLIYSARARLIDTQSKTVVAEGFCRRVPDNVANAPSYDALVARGAALLKTRLNAVGKDCFNDIRAHMWPSRASTIAAPSAAPPAESRPEVLATKNPDPPSVATAAGPTALPRTPTPPADATAAPRAFRTLEYTLRDRVTGKTRTVLYRLDPPEGKEGQQRSYNNGGWVEKLDGEVIAAPTSIAGEFDASIPPGGWLNDRVIQEGDAWSISYERPAGGGGVVRLKLDAYVDSPETLEIAGSKRRLIRVNYRGHMTRTLALGGGSFASGVYRASAWWSPELSRVVRFTVHTRGGASGAAFYMDEELELSDIR